MKYILLIISIITSSLAYSWDKDVAVDKLGDKLQDRWGDPVYLDNLSRKPVDRNGFPIKNEEIFNSDGMGKYNVDKPIYDNDGFKANRWDKK